MTDTFEALLVAVVAVLPGSLYTIARVNRGAGWAWRKEDAANQLIGFIGVSAAFHAIFAPVTYWAYREIIATDAVKTGQLSAWWWPLLLVYLLIPYSWGVLTVASRSWDAGAGRFRRCVRGAVALFAAKTPEPRAWDRILSNTSSSGWVRLRLTSGEWKAGKWVKPSFASGYGEEADLYLAQQLVLGPDGGDLTPCVGHAQSQECAGGSEMIQPDGKEKLPR